MSNNKKLFGYSIKPDVEDQKLRKYSPVPINVDDGVTAVQSGGYFGYAVELDKNARVEFELIRRYRSMAMHPEIDQAIDDIINEAIVSDSNDTPVRLDLTNLGHSERVKQIIRDEFNYILRLFNFNERCHEIFRKWYIDGRIYYHKIIDLEHPELGILELRNIDAMSIKPVREVLKPEKSENKAATTDTFSSQDSAAFGKLASMYDKDVQEYFIYSRSGFGQYLNPTGGQGSVPMSNPNNRSSVTVKMARDSVAYVTSGLIDGNTGTVLSYLNKAIKALNQLRMLEDSVVIYRVARAPERKAFYIDVANMPRHKVEPYMREVMNRHKTKISYNQSTGEVQDDRKFMSMLEDYWLPRFEGGRGTEIDTIAGGGSLGDLEELKFFRDKLMKSLNIPPSRQDGGGDGFQLGRSNDILRDELKFTKFVGRMRKRFSTLFTDVLRTQLILKGVCSPKEFDEMKEHIQYDFIYDNHFYDLKNLELARERFDLAAAMEPFVGKYYSVYHIRHKILKFTDEEINEMDNQIQYERQVGIIPDPNAMMPPGGEMAPPDGGMPPPDQGPPPAPPIESPPPKAKQPAKAKAPEKKAK